MTAKASGSSVSITWKAYQDADSYSVLRRSTGGKWETLKDGLTGLSYTDSTAKADTTYYYSVQAVSAKWGGQVKSSYDKNVRVKTAASSAAKTVGKAAVRQVASAAYNKLKITWTEVENATGYIVSRSTAKSGTYKQVKTVGSGSTTSYTDSGLTAGKTYYYKVQAFRKEGGETTKGAVSAAKGGKPVPAAPKVSVTAGKKQATVKWKKISGASGYVVYRSTSKNKGYKAVKTIAKGSTVSWKNTKLASKKTYYYKVRAYRTVSGKKVCSVYSGIVSVKAK